MSAESIIKLQDVTRTLTSEAVPVTLVKDVNFDIKAGEFVGITGPSGSGKSSLLYLMGLLDVPTHGQITLDGVDTITASAVEKARLRLQKVGFVFQFHFLLPEFSVTDNITLPMKKLGSMSEQAMHTRARDLLAHFGLADAGYKLPGQMSGGERQRVAIARAMANDPVIIMADEPSGSLDTHNAELVFDIFTRLVKEDKKTIVTITHEPMLAARTGRILRVIDGQVSEG